MGSVQRVLCALVLCLAVGCDGDDDTPIDAPIIDGAGAIDAPDTTIDARVVDAPMACVLPTQPITCTVGTDAPCTAQCAGAYCYAFGQVGNVCTNACTSGAQCPAGWSCNGMGRCRPP